MQYYPEKIALSLKAVRLLRLLLAENPRLEGILRDSSDLDVAKGKLKQWALEVISGNQYAVDYYNRTAQGEETYSKLRWTDYAAIRILDYIDYSGKEYHNPYLRDEKTVSDPFGLLWQGFKTGRGGAKPLFMEDMLYLFRQLNGKLEQNVPVRETVMRWMDRWSCGLDPRIIAIRNENKERIIGILARNIQSCDANDSRFYFPNGISFEQKLDLMREWWTDYRFHLRFAIRSPRLLNELLDYSLDLETLRLFEKAESKGVPIFINPYYLSLLNTQIPDFAEASDLAIRHYVIFSKQLVDEYGNIIAWEKEDRVEAGRPNAAGWILPSTRNVHRRYPEVAILIPDTMGRACGGLCVSCQRMYDFQRGNLGFDLEKFMPDAKWDEKLRRLLEYFENDTQLRDILITGGDAFMSQDISLEKILEEVFLMAKRKHEANRHRPDGEMYAEIVRVRLGTRLLAYLPQRVTPALTAILKQFREKALSIGVKQFVIQTHFESPLEITPESKRAVAMLLDAGWMVVNQQVFTAAASRRGHAAQLRRLLNDIGVIPYYTFSVKGFQENAFNYATNSRAVQEQVEEKAIGVVVDPDPEYATELHTSKRKMEMLNNVRRKHQIPFLATDRNVINLPGVGKSLTFRTIGITRFGRRILEFDHDTTRWHSPIIKKMGKVIIVESKPIGEYLNQLEEMGENREEYSSIWGYSIGETEKRSCIFEYPGYSFSATKRITNLEL